MYRVSNTTGPVGYGPLPGETGYSATPTTGQSSHQSLIARANAVPITHIFKHYGLRFSPYTHKTTCPFKSHKNGRENTPSFTLYENTNSYTCFGCGIGNRAVDFVAEMDQCHPDKAATKILQLFGTKVDEDLLSAIDGTSERTEIMLQFSQAVLEFRQTHQSQHAFQFIEHICWVYDRSNERHDYDNEALRQLVEQCLEHIAIYTPQLIVILPKDGT
jgi:hypothetical protein